MVFYVLESACPLAKAINTFSAGDGWRIKKRALFGDVPYVQLDVSEVAAVGLELLMRLLASETTPVDVQSINSGRELLWIPSSWIIGSTQEVS